MEIRKISGNIEEKTIVIEIVSQWTSLYVDSFRIKKMQKKNWPTKSTGYRFQMRTRKLRKTSQLRADNVASWKTQSEG